LGTFGTLPVHKVVSAAARRSWPSRVLRIGAGGIIAALLIWQGITSAAHRDPTGSPADSAVAALDIGVLVFREGLECILVLAAITASMVGASQAYRRPVATGASLGFLATLVTWGLAVRVIDDLTHSLPALQVQAATGLLAIGVLLVVMNWFFHKVYWTGWIALHTNRKRALLKSASARQVSERRLLLGLGLLGFTSLYREGVEVVLFLQNYRLKFGMTPVAWGVLVGLLVTGLVGLLTFVAHRRLPYRKMLVVTGVLLGVVLLVMVGEQAQEMQLAHWLPTTEIRWLDPVVPSWMGLWFSVFPTVETLSAQLIALALVLGSYVVARYQWLRQGRFETFGRLVSGP
jgi:high-affinity iron transporter